MKQEKKETSPAAPKGRKFSTKKLDKKVVILNSKKVPAANLEHARSLLMDPEKSSELVKKNASCLHYIHKYTQKPTSLYPIINLRLARQFLLRRDWKNFAKILSVSNPSKFSCESLLLPLFVKYGSIFLTYYNDKDQLDTFLQFIMNSMEYQTEEFIKRVFSYNRETANNADNKK